MKQYFKKMLGQTIPANIDSIFPKIQRIMPDLKQYPKYLYKYRDFSVEHNLEMLEKEYLWASAPENFIDPTDSIINLKSKKFLSETKKWLLEHVGEIIYYFMPPKGMPHKKKGLSLEKFKESQERFFDSSGTYSAKRAQKVLYLELQKLRPEDRKRLNKNFEEFENPEIWEKIGSCVKSWLTELTSVFSRKAFVCCLCKQNNNQKMWEDYSAVYTGFVIEYDLSKAEILTSCLPAIGGLFPVSYHKRKPAVDLLPLVKAKFYNLLYGKNISNINDFVALPMQMLIKKYEYRAEEEWRMIADTNKIEFPLISSVYMGYKISSKNENLLKGICEKKHIPVYKQKFNRLTGELQFELVSQN